MGLNKEKDFEWILDSLVEAEEQRQLFPTWRRSSDCLAQQLWGIEIVLCPDGTWFVNDTSGG